MSVFLRTLGLLFLCVLALSSSSGVSRHTSLHNSEQRLRSPSPPASSCGFIKQTPLCTRLQGGCTSPPRQPPTQPVMFAPTTKKMQKVFNVPLWEGVLGYINLWPANNIVLNDVEGRSNENTQGANVANVSIELRKKMTEMYANHVTDDGSGVDYEAIEVSPEFKEYLALASSLHTVDMGSMSREEKISFLLNTYNSMIIHAIVVLGPPGSLLSRLRMYSRASYRIGGLVYSLNDIENGLLRGNRKAPTPLSRVPFGPEDPRRAFTVTDMDPRIHFALNCGAKGCPPVRFYTPEQLDVQLERATKGFCRGVEIDEGKETAVLSQIFDWYKGDFVSGEDGSKPMDHVLKFITRYLDADQQAALQRISTEKLKLKFAFYDWALNKK